jgi:hypothetical protein
MKRFVIACLDDDFRTAEFTEGDVVAVGDNPVALNQAALEMARHNRSQHDRTEPGDRFAVCEVPR